MPLSEHERRQLEQIEAALRAGDPRFAGAVRAADPRVHYRRRVVAAALGFLVGVGLLLTGVVVNVILVGVAGFVVLLVCTLWAVTSYRRMTGRAPSTGPPPPRDMARARREPGGAPGVRSPARAPPKGRASRRAALRFMSLACRLVCGQFILAAAKPA